MAALLRQKKEDQKSKDKLSNTASLTEANLGNMRETLQTEQKKRPKQNKKKGGETPIERKHNHNLFL